jgi:TFIIF-interacting CTD phosphatase-like protein
MAKYVVLDLDSTLIYSTDAIISEACVPSEDFFFVRPIARKMILKVQKRNHLDWFLDMLGKRYKIIVWSAGGENYVKDIVSVLFKNRNIEYLLTCNHLADEMKKLSVIKNFVPNFEVKNCRLVDDNEDHMRGQEENFILVNPFKGESDDELKRIYEKLERNF